SAARPGIALDLPVVAASRKSAAARQWHGASRDCLSIDVEAVALDVAVFEPFRGEAKVAARADVRLVEPAAAGRKAGARQRDCDSSVLYVGEVEPVGKQLDLDRV